MQLAGKRALVTGGSRGIGRAIVEVFAQQGASVAFTYERSKQQAQDLESSIHSMGGHAIAFQADSASVPALEAAVQEGARSLGGLDILINNAGIYRGGTIDQLSLGDLDALLSVNVRAVVVATKAALASLPEGGRIINIGSCLAQRVAWQGSAAYAMTKSALDGFTRGLARDLGPRRITINTVHPGPTLTDMTSEEGEFATTMRQHVATKRFSTAEQIASAVLYLAGTGAENITGTSLTLDGGLNA